MFNVSWYQNPCLISSRVKIGTNVCEVLHVVIVFASIDDGNAVYLVFCVQEAVFVSVFMDCREDVTHLLAVDSKLRFAILVGGSRFYLYEV